MEAHAYLKFPDDESDSFSEVPRESHDVVWWNFTLWKRLKKKKSEKLFWIYMCVCVYIYIYLIIHIYLCVYTQIHTYKYT